MAIDGDGPDDLRADRGPETEGDQTRAPRADAPPRRDDAPSSPVLRPQVLLVEDEAVSREAVSLVLRADGDDVVGVDSGEAALAVLASGVFDIVILDLGLPGISGFETLRQIRERSDVPVLIVTGSGTLAERIAGFDLGADDYLVKPVELPELSRRVRAIVRRRRIAVPDGDELLGPAGIVMRLRAHTVHVGGEEVDLTPREFDVLRLLLEQRGKVISPDELSTHLWGYETFGSRNFVEAHISRLRSKLARAGANGVVTTMRGVGYVVR